jgi:chaperonin cofactor prefoldin
MYTSDTKNTQPKVKTVVKADDKRIAALESKVSSLLIRIDRMQSVIDKVTHKYNKLSNNLDTITAIIRSKK